MWNKIRYSDLNAKQKEIYNFQKLAAVLADYGFNCIKLADDWRGADFLAYHKDGDETLRVQLKGRIAISKKYENKDLYMAFRISGDWCLIKHDILKSIVDEHTNWLETDSWKIGGEYSAGKPNKAVCEALGEYILATT